MIVNRRIAWPLVITCGLFLASLLGILGFRLFAFGSSVTGNKPGSIELDGTRTYFVHLPPAYNGKTLLPVVIVLHGAGESPEGAEKLSSMSVEADKENFIAVYPRGTGRMNPARMPAWNSGNCCGYAQQN